MAKFYHSCPFFRGMNRRPAEKLARRELGAIIRIGSGDGHHVASHPFARQSCTYNCRRKDSTTDFIDWCRDIWLLMQDRKDERQIAA